MAGRFEGKESSGLPDDIREMVLSREKVDSVLESLENIATLKEPPLSTVSDTDEQKTALAALINWHIAEGEIKIGDLIDYLDKVAHRSNYNDRTLIAISNIVFPFLLEVGVEPKIIGHVVAAIEGLSSDKGRGGPGAG